jgi:ketosteroid isomerase-like protein
MRKERKGPMMVRTQDPERIRKVANELDDALEEMDLEKVLSFLHEDFEMEMLGVILKGGDGARKGFQWLLQHVSMIRFEPVAILVQDDLFFEEFIVHGTLKNGKKVTSKQAEVLVFEDYKVRSLRLYFDRLDFAGAVVKGPLEKKLVSMLISRSKKGLE